MAAYPDVDIALRHIRANSDQIATLLAELPPAGWEGPTNCPPWRVRDLVGHVITSGEQHRLSVERGVAGSVEPPYPEAERERRIAEAAALGPAELLARLAAETAATEATYQRLSAEQLAALAYHRRGNRPARWFVQHRLAEVAFHAWDLERSLGRQAALDPDTATFLLPMLLETNLPRNYLSGPRGRGRVRLVAEGQAGGSWVLDATPERLEVRRNGGDADLTITAGPVVLCLLAYGRADPLAEERAGRARIEGDRALAERFNTIFPGP
jgi:uncharacterized protein (TIGR03083 family)